MVIFSLLCFTCFMLITSLLLFAKFYASFASFYYEIIASILTKSKFCRWFVPIRPLASPPEDTTRLVPCTNLWSHMRRNLRNRRMPRPHLHLCQCYPRMWRSLNWTMMTTRRTSLKEMVKPCRHHKMNQLEMVCRPLLWGGL
jgi:hypothetical protein